MSPPVRVVLFTEVNSKFGAPFLEILTTDPRCTVAALVTSPPGKLCDYYVGEPNQVDVEALARGRDLQVHRPGSVNDPDFITELRGVQADYHVIANFQQIFKPVLLAVPGTATVNFHPAPLPRYAGLAPFFWMAKHGEQQGGTSALLVEPTIDTGPLLAQRQIALTGTETAGEIRDRHFAASVDLLRELLPRLAARELAARAQDLTRRSYYGNPGPDDRRVDWKDDTETIQRTIRACLPQPGADAILRGDPIRIFSAVASRDAGSAEPGTVRPGLHGQPTVATGDGWLTLERYERHTRPR
ncbi:MAG: formyltransferase family protein [Acetobacteraceae bacterium]|jgi:methionyl-tRNA formyltransferase|nr:formyltransferase family protein [Acetobacteraceae bacterium]